MNGNDFDSFKSDIDIDHSSSMNAFPECEPDFCVQFRSSRSMKCCQTFEDDTALPFGAQLQPQMGIRVTVSTWMVERLQDLFSLVTCHCFNNRRIEQHIVAEAAESWSFGPRGIVKNCVLSFGVCLAAARTRAVPR